MPHRIRHSRILAILLLCAAACGDSAFTGEPEPVTLHVVSWGGAYQAAMTDAWFEPYAEANPHVTVVQHGPTDYAQIEGMVEDEEVIWDVVDVENVFGLARTAHLLEPIDCTKVPCAELQPDLFQTTGYRVPVMVWALAVAYRTGAWAEVPASWDDFFDLDRFPGTRTVRRSGPGSGILEGALLADGVDPAELYPLDVERALAKLATIVDEIVWWEDGQECVELLASGAAEMGVCYNGRVYDAQQDGAALTIQWNGALTQADYLVVPRGSPNVAAAMDMIAYMTSVDHNARLAAFISYGPVNIGAVDDVPPSIAPDLPSSYSDVTIARDDVWLEDSFDAVSLRFEQWLAQHGVTAPDESDDIS